MQSNKYFTSYYPVNSKIHSLNSIIKIICLLLLLVPIIASSDLKLHVFMLFITIVLIYYSKVPIRFYTDTIFGLRYVYIIFIFLLASRGLYFETAILILIKILIVLLYLSVIFYTTSSSEIKYALEKILTPFNIFNVNISPVINKLVNIIIFFPLLFSTEREVLMNASSKGLNYYGWDILSRYYSSIKGIKNTLRLTFEKMNKIKISSILRGYSTKRYRTNFRANKVGFNDIVLLIVHLIFIAYYIFERGLL